MSEESIEQVREQIRSARRGAEWAASVLNDPDTHLGHFDLTSEERKVLQREVHDAAREMTARLTTGPRPPWKDRPGSLLEGGPAEVARPPRPDVRAEAPRPPWKD